MAKKGSKKAATTAVSSSRVRKTTKKQDKVKAKKLAQGRPKIPSSFTLLRQVYGVFRANWKKLLGIVVIYLVLNVVFASGFGTISSTINSIKNDVKTSQNLSSTVGTFSGLVGSAGTGSSQTGSVLQTLLIVIESLVIIWALRHIIAKKTITVKEAYYRSMMPL